MTVTVFSEETEAEQVYDEPHDPHIEDHLGVVDVFRLVKTFQTLHRDRETESHQKNGVHQSS